MGSRDSNARILEVDEYFALLPTGADGYGACFRILNGIVNEVDKRLFELPAVSMDKGNVFELEEE